MTDDPLEIAGADAAVVFPALEPTPGVELTEAQADALLAEAEALISKEPPLSDGGGS